MNSPEQVSTICVECGGSIAFALGATQAQCSYCASGMAVAEGTRLIRLQCPGCAGNFYYIDGLMGGRCPYCDAALLALTRHRVLRFVVRQRTRAPAGDAALCLVPFWQLTGIIYGWDMGSQVAMERDSSAAQSGYGYGDDSDAVPAASRRDSGPKKVFRGRVVERWIPDPSAQSLGIASLRLRAAVFPMEPFAAEHEQLGRVLPATLDIATARERLRAIAMSVGYASDGLTRLDCQRADLVAESLSLVYYPFWIRRRGQGQGGQGGAGDEYEIWDAVTGQPEPLGAAGRGEPGRREIAIFDQLAVVELRCGQCGHALESGNHTVVYPCRHCVTFWVAEKDGLSPFRARYAEPFTERDSADELVWLPFWRVTGAVDLGGRRAATARDARTVLNLLAPPGGSPGAHPDSPIAYFVPAYGAMRAPKLDAAARDMTRLQPRLTPGAFSSGELFSCFYGPDDAQKLAYVVWLQVVPGALWRRLSSLRVQPGEVDLWYIPFAARRRELVNLLTGARYDRMAFRGLGH